MTLGSYHAAPVRVFSSVDWQITLHFVLDYPTPATASRVKATRMSGFLARHSYIGRVPAQVVAERLQANLLTATSDTVAGKSISVQAFTRLLQQLNTQFAEYDDALAAVAAEHDGADEVDSGSLPDALRGQPDGRHPEGEPAVGPGSAALESTTSPTPPACTSSTTASSTP